MKMRMSRIELVLARSLLMNMCERPRAREVSLLVAPQESRVVS